MKFNISSIHGSITIDVDEEKYNCKDVYHEYDGVTTNEGYDWAVDRYMEIFGLEDYPSLRVEY